VDPVIVAADVGIKFNRNRRRKLRVRELFIHGAKRVPTGTFWAFRDVSFEIAEGESVGVVGANGEGKSTLLRLIAGVMLPDEGSVAVHQPVASIIELGAGFASGLTGRDNIYLKAGLHGRSREWVEEHFDSIVEFAGDQVARSLDLPFRHYSSGMKVRLGFSVVTQLDEPIILVDEVLAVGDRAFRRRCYQRFEELTAHGRTLFLVSHNERHLRRFCTRGLYLRGGELAFDGPMEECLERYTADMGDDDDDGDAS
jgi:ABC-2 type transport system ATP-binding protein